MVTETFGNQHHADHHQKAQRQHFDGRMRVDEFTDGSGKQHHQAERGDHGGDHDAHIVDHTDSGDDGVQREDQIDDDDLGNGGGQIDLGLDVSGVVFVLAFQRLVNFAGAFPDQKQATGQQYQVAT